MLFAKPMKAPRFIFSFGIAVAAFVLISIYSQSSMAQERSGFQSIGTVYNLSGQPIPVDRYRVAVDGSHPRTIGQAIELIETALAGWLKKSNGRVYLRFFERNEKTSPPAPTVTVGADGSLELLIVYSRVMHLTGESDAFELPKLSFDSMRSEAESETEGGPTPKNHDAGIMIRPRGDSPTRIPVTSIQGKSELPLLNEIPDFMVLRFFWTEPSAWKEGDNRDFDIRVAALDATGHLGNDLGYARSIEEPSIVGRGLPRMVWSLDNVQFGYESVLIDLRHLKAAGKLKNFDVVLRGMWFRGEKVATAYIDVTAYQGGPVWLDRKKYLFRSRAEVMGMARFAVPVRPANAGSAQVAYDNLVRRQQAYLSQHRNYAESTGEADRMRSELFAADSAVNSEKAKDNGQLLGLLRFDVDMGKVSLLEASHPEARKRLRGAVFR